ncbi:hypothetical protein [Streptosporangium sp. V21-05]|uniref:hypothetical protein n=1 Tax=Streptosporangium sp. V21-05 TaxID=3446115 RepID=UPI003F52942E
MQIYAKVRQQNGPDSSTAKHVAGAVPLPASNERIGAPLIMTASTTRKQRTPHIVLPSEPPRLTPGAATELLAILLEAHQTMLVNCPNVA